MGFHDLLAADDCEARREAGGDPGGAHFITPAVKVIQESALRDCHQLTIANSH
jgi:hypothetical protein